MSDFNPLAPAHDRENYAPSHEDGDVHAAPKERPFEPEPGFEIVTDGSVLRDGQTVRVWRGSRWRSATIRGKVMGSIATVMFLQGGSGTPHISRIAVQSTVPDATATHPLLLAAMAERNRHEEKGWTAEHDDEHGSEHLRGLAVSYLTGREPGTSREQLVAAVALCMAEWDRETRARRGTVHRSLP